MSSVDPTDRFSGLADLYSRFRPSYPSEAIDFILSNGPFSPGETVLDVGCGTGISSRLLAERGLRVIGIEPNADMIARARQEDTRGIEYVVARAEQTGLPDGCASGVVAAQAFHWFDPELSLQEFHRLLRPKGTVALLWNERDDDDPATRAYSAVIQASEEARKQESRRQESMRALWESSLFEGLHQEEFDQAQSLSRDGLIGRLFSVSYAPKEPTERDRWSHQANEVFDRFATAGQFTLRYKTRVTIGSKRSVVS